MQWCGVLMCFDPKYFICFRSKSQQMANALIQWIYMILSAHCIVSESISFMRTQISTALNLMYPSLLVLSIFDHSMKGGSLFLFQWDVIELVEMGVPWARDWTLCKLFLLMELPSRHRQKWCSLPSNGEALPIPL